MFDAHHQSLSLCFLNYFGCRSPFYSRFLRKGWRELYFLGSYMFIRVCGLLNFKVSWVNVKFGSYFMFLEYLNHIISLFSGIKHCIKNLMPILFFSFVNDMFLPDDQEFFLSFDHSGLIFLMYMMYPLNR